MRATSALPIAKMYAFKPVDAAAEADRKDAMYAFYVSRAQIQIRRSLATQGRAVGSDYYDHPAVCALLEDLVATELSAVLSLIDLGQAYAQDVSDADLGRLARRMFDEATLHTASITADALIDDEPSPKRFLPAGQR